MTSLSPSQAMLATMWSALDGDPDALAAVRLTGEGGLSSVFATTDLAQASIAAAGLALAGLVSGAGGACPEVSCDRRLAAMWFSSSLRPEGWAPPPLWDAVAGDYRAADGWIRLHTNASHHRAAALAALGLDAGQATREDVGRAVSGWRASELESAVVAHGGCAAEMRSQAQWASHPQGAAVAAEPLVACRYFDAAAAAPRPVDPLRPLAGVRVLDLTRVLAGPTATRLLAAFGADVLRIDPASWEEPGVVPDMTLGKRCAGLDLRQPAGRAVLEALVRQADVMVHGYRADALERLGLGAHRRRELNPGLVDVALNAYGWSGPWSSRRGFDSLVQMSSGIAEAGMRRLGRDKPTPLPVQALDHATGYLMATAAIRGLTQRLKTGEGGEVRTSLARMAQLLVTGSGNQIDAALAAENAGDLAPAIEQTFWGPAQRVRGAVTVGGAAMAWDRPAAPLGSAQPVW